MTISGTSITFLPMVEKTNTHHEFAARLSAELDRQRLSVKELSQACDVTYEMARRYTLGTAKPRAEKITRIAQWLGVEPSWLEYGTVAETGRLPIHILEPNNQIDEGELSGLDDFSHLSEDEKRLLRVFRQFPYIEARNMLLSFEARYKQVKDYYRKK